MIKIGQGNLNIRDFEEVLFNGGKVELSNDALRIVDESYHFLEKFAKNKIIYGINTGFGPMAQYKIEDKLQKELQYNLIRSHASGFGKHLDLPYSKACMLARLNTLSLGYSGIHNSAVYILRDLINHNINPLIFEHGGVGASGDLVQLAHMALVLIGEGEVEFRGKIQNTKDVFKSLKLQPMEIHLREGLAVMNGTSVMTGIGLINSIYAKRAVEWSIALTIMICEMVDAFDDYFSKELNESKKHIGQQRVAESIRTHLAKSKFIRKRDQHLYENNIEEEILMDKVQEYYSIRCVPQILGTILETVDQCQKLLIEEANSANDNPIVDVKAQNVVHGGNFHGDYVSFEMDKLKIAITKLSMLAERQLNFLMNPKLNDLLQPFANLGRPGFNFGMQGVQFTATSTTAENQTLSNPMYIHSIPNNNDNQDIVSMGTNAALITKKVVDNTFEVLSIELISAVQAIDYLGKYKGLSPKSKEIYDLTRQVIPKFVHDYPIYKDLRKVKEFLLNSSPEIL